jgi:hypothetical protein
VELLLIYSLFCVCALQLLCIVRTRRALLAAEERADRLQRASESSFRREMSFRAALIATQMMHEQYMRGNGPERRSIAEQIERERAEAAPPARPNPTAVLSDVHERINEAYRAEARGTGWLKSCLSPEQLADYDRTRSFVVIGGHTGDRYRICWGTSQNIIRLLMREGREVAIERLCFGPRGVPIGDILLHQKIALEGDEEAALRIAGRSPVPIAVAASVADGRLVSTRCSGGEVGTAASHTHITQPR